MNGDVSLKSLKFILLFTAIAALTVYAVAGSLADDGADEKYLTIVQSEFERNASGFKEVTQGRELHCGVQGEPEKESVSIEHDFSVTDKKQHTVSAELSFQEDLYNAPNVLDHIVVVTNTGSINAYVRTWFAFEMGDLTEEEFKDSIVLNRNLNKWNWEEFQYGVEIGGKNFAVVCAEYDGALNSGETTEPNLLQVYLKNHVSSDISRRIDGDGDGKYEIIAHSRAVSDAHAWGNVIHTWDISTN